LMGAVVESENMRAAYRRVVGNKGSAGVDGMSVAELKPCLISNWRWIREELPGGVVEAGSQVVAVMLTIMRHERT